MNKIDLALAENLGLTQEEIAALELNTPLNQFCLHFEPKAITEAKVSDHNPFHQPNPSIFDLVKAR